MRDPVFERYKEALRAGHVAALRGRLDEALIQYRTAASIAPDRPVPLASMADVLLSLGRLDEARTAGAAALRLDPHDALALEVTARVLEGAGEPDEAALLLDRLADAMTRAENFEAGYTAAARARDLQPTPERENRAARLDGVRRSAAAPASPARALAGDASEGAPPSPGSPNAGAGALALPVRAPTREPDREAPPPVSITPGPRLLGAASAGEGDAEALVLAATQLMTAGDRAGAAALRVRAADAYLAMGATETAIDECLQALLVSPDDTSVYLALARIYMATGHPDRARVTLGLLERFLDLGDDRAGLEAIAALRNRATGAAGRPERPLL